MNRTLFVLLVLIGAVPVHAGIEARFRFAFASPGNPVHYVYELKLVSGRLEPGATVSQHMTFYDVGGLIPGSSSQPPGWTSTIQGTGIDADDIPRRGREDSPRFLNVTWTYAGATTIDASAGPVVLGDFEFDVMEPAAGGLLLYISQSSSATGPRQLVGRVNGAVPR